MRDTLAKIADNFRNISKTISYFGDKGVLIKENSVSAQRGNSRITFVLRQLKDTSTYGILILSYSDVVQALDLTESEMVTFLNAANDTWEKSKQSP